MIVNQSTINAEDFSKFIKVFFDVSLSSEDCMSASVTSMQQSRFVFFDESVSCLTSTIVGFDHIQSLSPIAGQLSDNRVNFIST